MPDAPRRVLWSVCRPVESQTVPMGAEAAVQRLIMVAACAHNPSRRLMGMAPVWGGSREVRARRASARAPHGLSRRRRRTRPLYHDVHERPRPRAPANAAPWCATRKRSRAPPNANEPPARPNPRRQSDVIATRRFTHRRRPTNRGAHVAHRVAPTVGHQRIAHAIRNRAPGATAAAGRRHARAARTPGDHRTDRRGA